ncbi:MAG: hypothetical protein FJ247_13170 [Nitrospira sp.]|nr:hypothetical protein [Nitrospira sp.]
MMKPDTIDRTEREIATQLMYCALDLRDYARVNQREDLAHLSNLIESCALQVETAASELRH